MQLIGTSTQSSSILDLVLTNSLNAFENIHVRNPFSTGPCMIRGACSNSKLLKLMTLNTLTLRMGTTTSSVRVSLASTGMRESSKHHRLMIAMNVLLNTVLKL